MKETRGGTVRFELVVKDISEHLKSCVHTQSLYQLTYTYWYTCICSKLALLQGPPSISQWCTLFSSNVRNIVEFAASELTDIQFIFSPPCSY